MGFFPSFPSIYSFRFCIKEERIIILIETGRITILKGHKCLAGKFMKVYRYLLNHIYVLEEYF